LHEKEVLLQEIHHRVKNNLQIISSLLDFQAEATDDPRVCQAFTESQARIQSMAHIHEHLYSAENLAQIGMAGYLSDLVADLAYSYAAQHLAIEVQVADLALDMNQALPCGLLVNELVSNALKHAFPGGRMGKIWVTLGPGEGGLVLAVGDNGVGLPPDMDLEEPRSLGLRLVTMFSRQLKGFLSIERGETGGTTFRIAFPTLDRRSEGA
jgi:two-component sensor histidine kinase